jgi:hypothetical protein
MAKRDVLQLQNCPAIKCKLQRNSLLYIGPSDLVTLAALQLANELEFQVPDSLHEH